ncbi:YceI family protein [Helicobacter cynogastricus]|uniref:YceI family protein n=1 Tax=Helicobacter cynogastricus TaxID=329937 RepID=UPI000CF1546E|nr:YceI family protein [Helicobacter cynogastricus]
MKRFLQCFVALCALGVGLKAQEYTIDNAHSRVGFKVKHLKLSSVHGDFKDYSAVIDFDPKSRTFKKLEATIKATSINTNNTKRDTHLRSDEFFKVEKYPDLHFVMQKYEKVNAHQGRMIGTLNIAGVAHKVVLHTEVGVAQHQGQNKLGFSLNGKIKRLDFKLAPEKSTHLIGDVVALDIEIEATQK